MSINIRIAGDHAEQELRSLYDWLRDEPNVRQHAEIRLVSKELNSDEMGDTLDLISLIVTSSLQVPTLVDVISGWIGTRRGRPKVTIERGEMRVEVSGTSAEEVVKILNAMEPDD
ncbi:hypothetical protein OHA25_13525 [Nonomuraea sp. NBC_00507]|uniref:effector-associated constant component EACC1 n=1 Tax=unclassified Nonomuraea TaxID=2593643 RepID=UPI002E17FFE0